VLCFDFRQGPERKRLEQVEAPSTKRILKHAQRLGLLVALVNAWVS
jgi:hypothetical protein